MLLSINLQSDQTQAIFIDFEHLLHYKLYIT